MNKIFSNY